MVHYNNKICQNCSLCSTAALAPSWIKDHRSQSCIFDTRSILISFRRHWLAPQSCKILAEVFCDKFLCKFTRVPVRTCAEQSCVLLCAINQHMKNTCTRKHNRRVGFVCKSTCKGFLFVCQVIRRHCLMGLLRKSWLTCSNVERLRKSSQNRAIG